MDARVPYFEPVSFKVCMEGKADGSGLACSATVKIMVKETEGHVVAEGNNSKDALYLAIAKALGPYYTFPNMKLVNYGAETVNAGSKDEKTKVYIAFSDQKGYWVQEASSTHDVHAIFQALVQGFHEAIHRQSASSVYDG